MAAWLDVSGEAAGSVARALVEPLADDDGLVVDLRVLEWDDRADRTGDLTSPLAPSTLGEAWPGCAPELIHALDDADDQAVRVRLRLPAVPEAEREARVLDVWAAPAHDGRISLLWHDATAELRLEDAVRDEARLYRSLVESGPDPVLVLDRDEVLWASPTISAALGRPPGEWEGVPFEDFLHPDDCDRSRRSRRDAAAGVRVRQRLRVSDRLGAYHWVDMAMQRREDSPDQLVACLRVVDADVATLQQLRRDEDRYRLVLGGAADVVVCSDTAGRVTYASPPVREMLGYEPGRLLGTPAIDLVHPADLAKVKAARGAAFDPDAPSVTARARMRRADGEYVWVESVARPLVGRDGQVVGSVATWRDVQARVAAERLEAVREQQFRLLAENASDVVLLNGPDRRVLWVSPGIRTLGWEPHEVVGLPFSVFLRPEFAARTEPQRAALYRGEEPELQPWRFEVRAKDGTWRWMTGHVKPLKGPDGRMLGVVTGLQDVTELMHAEQLHEAMVRASLDPLAILASVRDGAGRIVDFRFVEGNEAAAAAEGASVQDLVGRSYRASHPPEHDRGYFEALVRVAESGTPLVVDGEKGPFDADLEDRLFDLRAFRVQDGVGLTWRDVTDRVTAARRLAETEERYRLLAENVSDVVSLARDRVLLWISPAVTRVFGYRPDEVVGRPVDLILHPDDVATRAEARRRVLQGEEVVSRQRVRHKDGTYRWTEARSRLVRPGGDLVVTWRLIDDEVAHEAALTVRAHFDPLTGLANRAAAFDALEHELRGRPRTGSRTALAFCDIDNLKEINDALGHATGDAVLRVFAEVAGDALRSEDLLARIGGDEFLLQMHGLHDLADAEHLTARLLERLRVPVTIAGSKVRIRVSVGLTLVEPSDTAESAVDRADRAMYQAKHAGGDRICTA